MSRPYEATLDRICRSNGWVLGEDKGQVVLGIPGGDGGQIAVVVDEFQDSSGQQALRFWAAVAPQSKVKPDQALGVNAQLPHGALALKDGQLVMLATRVLNQTSPADLTTILSAVAYYAAFYRKHYGA